MGSRISEAFWLNWDRPGDFAKFSCARRTSKSYIGYRIVVFLYFLYWFIRSLVYNSVTVPRMPYFLLYLSLWNYALNLVSNLLYIIVATRSYVDPPEVMPALYKIHWGIYTAMGVSGFLIPLFYWSFVYPFNTDKVTTSNVHMHGVYSLQVCADVWISSTPWRLGHVWLPILFGWIYAAFSYIYYLLGGVNEFGDPYIYFVLDYGDRPTLSALVLLALSIVFTPAAHLVMCSLYFIRHFSIKFCCCLQQYYNCEYHDIDKD